ncbi:MAG: Lrp/AsnC family transcriptional regulator [Desulfurococcales archaeon]|nr:Lrp/AsnC family transcriptional regulator [Desulfurococcales archaeon]
MQCLDELDKRILMELQYDFPRDAYPFDIVAERLDLRVDKLIDRVNKLHRYGILKRIGFYVNYRGIRLKAALIAYESKGLVDELAKIYSRDKLATHVYLRDHPVYDVWVVTKRRTLDELVEHALEVSSTLGINHIVLYSKRTYKLSVKFDLYQGISRSGKYSSISISPPSPETFGISPGQLRMFRRLDVSREPYRKIAEELGLSQEEAASLAWKLVDVGLLGDPGAALDGKKIGFEENAMVVMEPNGDEDTFCRMAVGLPYTSHVVLRGSIPEGAWTHTCYFMIHAVDKDRIRSLIDDAVVKMRPRSFMVLRSLADLKPGTIR